MKWAVVTLNRQSIQLGKRLKENVHPQVEVDIFTLDKYMEKGLIRIENGLKSFNKVLFEDYRVIVYVMAMGIIVREIAPYLKHKSVDPAVLCLSIDGKFVIPVLSGHLGGANAIANDIAKSMNASAVITTASDLLHKKAVDIFAQENNFLIESFEMAKVITAMMINEEQVDIISSKVIEGVDTHSTINEKSKGAVVVSNKTDLNIELPFVQLIPQNLVIGIGARRNIPFEAIESLLKTILFDHKLTIKAIHKIASIDLKEKEAGILTLAEKLGVPFITYPAEILSEVETEFESSDFVKKITGVGCVSMPSGYIASNRGACLVKKVAYKGITLSVWEEKE